MPTVAIGRTVGHESWTRPSTQSLTRALRTACGDSSMLCQTTIEWARASMCRAPDSTR